MDINEALVDMLMDLQLATQSGTRDAFLANLEHAAQTMNNMREWVEKGGFGPTESFTFESFHLPTKALKLNI